MWGQKRPRKRAKGTTIEWTGPKPVKRSQRPKVVAVFNDPGMKAAIANRAVPARYQEPPIVSDEMEAACALGSPIVAKFDLQIGYERGVYPFAPLERSYASPGTPMPVPKGSLLVYAGPVATTERKWTMNGGGLNEYHDVRVYKHTFITPYGRCIIHDFNLIAIA